VVQEKVELLCAGITTSKEKEEVLVLTNAFSALAGDVAMEYSFGFSYNHLEIPGFREHFHYAFMALGSIGGLTLQFPWMVPVSVDIST